MKRDDVDPKLFARLAEIGDEFHEIEDSFLEWQIGGMSFHKSTELAKRLDSYPTYRRGLTFPLHEDMVFVTVPFTRSNGSPAIAIVLRWNNQTEEIIASWVRAERAAVAEEACAFLNSELAATWAYHRNPPPGDAERREQARAQQQESIQAIQDLFPPPGMSMDEVMSRLEEASKHSPLDEPAGSLWGPRDAESGNGERVTTFGELAAEHAGDYPGKALGLPPPNAHFVMACGIRGIELVGAIFQPKLRAFIQDCLVEHPLLRHGHAGVSFDGGQTVYAVALPDPETLGDRAHLVPPALVIDTREFEAAKVVGTEYGYESKPSVAALSYSAVIKHEALTQLIDTAGVLAGRSSVPPRTAGGAATDVGDALADGGPYRARALATTATTAPRSDEQLAALAEHVIKEYRGLDDYGAEWLVGHIAVWKSSELARRPSQIPTYRRGLVFELTDDMAFVTVPFARTTGAQAVAIMLRSANEELFACWVPAERAADAEAAVSFLNSELAATWAHHRNPPPGDYDRRLKAIGEHTRAITALRANRMLPDAGNAAGAVSLIERWAQVSPLDRSTWPDSQLDDALAPRKTDDGGWAVGFFAELGYPGDWPPLAIALAKRAPKRKAEVLRYLRGGRINWVALRTPDDVFAPGNLADEHGVLHDGKYCWPGELAYYVECYDVALPAKFEKHMARRKWKPANEHSR